jgi:hypothetical protein
MSSLVNTLPRAPSRLVALALIAALAAAALTAVVLASGASRGSGRPLPRHAAQVAPQRLDLSGPRKDRVLSLGSPPRQSSVNK